MQLQQFESLRERLLRAGVAPRHVRRFLRELHDHYEDALRVELTKFSDPSAARNAAWARLGTEESLAQGMPAAIAAALHRQPRSQRSDGPR